MRYFIHKNSGVLFIALLAATLVLLLPSHHAKAINIPPDPGENGLGSVAPTFDSLRYNSSYKNLSNFGQGDQDTPYYDVGNDKDYTYGHMETRAYVNTEWGGSVTITVFNAASDCYQYSGGGVVGPDYYTVGGAFRTTFTVLGNGWSSSKSITSGGCGATLSFSVPVRNAFGITKTTNFDGYFDIQANIPVQINEGENSFWYSIDAGSNGGVIGSGSTTFGEGFRKYNLNNGNYWNSWSTFALPFTCSALSDPISSRASVRLFDLDATTHPEWSNNMIIALQREHVDANNNLGGWSTIASRTQNQGFSSGQDWTFTTTFQSDYIYRVILINMGVRNTVFVKVDSPLSTLYSKLSERPSNATCVKQSVSCNASAEATTIPDGATDVITVNGTSSGSWPRSYFIKRVGPSYKNVTSAGDNSGKDKVIPPDDSSTTYTYTVYDSKTGSKADNSGTCNVTIKTIAKPGISCTATPSETNVPINTGVQITVTLYNNSSYNLQRGQLRQTSPGGGAWPSSGFGNFTKGQQASHTFTISPRPTAKTVPFEYTLFKSTSRGSAVFPTTSNPLCTTQITWYEGPPPPVGIVINPACGTTNIYSDGSPHTTATYTKTVIVNPPYQTNTKPDNYPLRPYTWATAPPPVTGGLYTYTGPGPYTKQQNGTPADMIPIHLTFQGSDGTTNYADLKLHQADGYSVPIDTFNTWGFLWPHVSYTIKLEAQTKGDLGVDENGPYDYNFSTTANLAGSCLQYSACLAPGVDPGPVEPGHDYTFTYKVQFNNLTNKRFDTNSTSGYYFRAYASGGITYRGDEPADADSIQSGDSTPVSISIPTRVDYSGNYWVEFWYNGSIMDSLDPGWDGTCPPGNDTPATRPYFQVWNSDTSAGGGFRTPNGVCPTNAPGYISPTTTGYDYAGGIRAFAKKSAGRGSMTDFGAIAMGLIPGSEGGPMGFFSGNGAIFANTGYPSGDPPGSLGGYLHSNSTGHCVDDFFTNTRKDSQSTVNILNGNPTSGQYILTGGTLSRNTLNLTANRQVTVYVDGDLTIDQNVNYPDKYEPNVGHVPYFAVIVRGNITLTSGVTHLDGLYVAQPRADGSGGVFSTCDSTCNSQLIINGAVIAQKVDLLRSHGTLDPGDSQASDTIGSNPAEIINYVPSMVIGTPYFQQVYGGVETIFSLPPVF
ncbi:MAG TPA: hypothetical protein VFW90_02525 [Candidatus Saccharimonadales bacterium]|nr:hypothetical protein [Candidatus Saccharimonadales bacterium]